MTLSQSATSPVVLQGALAWRSKHFGPSPIFKLLEISVNIDSMVPVILAHALTRACRLMNNFTVLICD